MKSNTLPESLSRPCFVVMRVLAARGVRAPSSRRPGGLNAHYSGGQILFFVSPRGEHLHDGVTPRPTEKNFQPRSRSPLFSPFSDPLARKSAQKRGAARSQTLSPRSSSRSSPCARRGPAICPSIVRTRVVSAAGGVVNSVPAAVRRWRPRQGTRVGCLFVRLPVDLNWDEVALLSRVCGAERRPVCSRVLHDTPSDKKPK